MLVALERRTNFSKEKNSFHCHAKIPYIREKASLNKNPLRHTMMTEGFSLIARHQRGGIPARGDEREIMWEGIAALLKSEFRFKRRVP